ncbi:MAG: nucleotidyltransferase domain-containing protein [Minisyncoccia bacterium]
MNNISTTEYDSVLKCIKYLCRYNRIIVPDNLVLTSSYDSNNVLKSIIPICNRLGFEIQIREINFKVFTTILFSTPLIAKLNHSYFIITNEYETQEIIDINSGVKQKQLRNLFCESTGKTTIINLIFKSATNILPVDFGDGIEKDAKLLLNKYFPNCYAAGITGSYASGNNNSQSDIDIILISELVSEICSESFYFNNSIFDVFVYPKNHLERIFNIDIYNRKGIILGMFRKIYIIHDTDNFLTNIKIKTAYLYDDGPPPAQHKIFMELKFKILSDISDLKGDLTREKNLMILSKSIGVIIDFHSVINRSWSPSGKYIPAFLAERYPDFHSRLFHVLEDFYINNNLIGVIVLMEDLVNSSTNKFQKKSNSFVLNEKNDDILVVGFYGITDQIYFLSNILIPIVEEIGESNYFFYQNNNFNYSNINYFLKIYDFGTSKETIYKKLKKIRYEFKNRIPQLKIIFPYNLLDISHLNYTETPLFANTYFKKLSFLFTNHLMNSKKWTMSYGLKLASQYNLELISQNGFKNELVLSFYKIILENWLSCLFENRNNNYLQIKDLIKWHVIAFEKKYASQKDEKQESEDQNYSNVDIKLWGIKFSTFKKNKITTVPSFHLFKYINSKKIGDQNNLFNFYIYKSLIEYFCDLVSLNRTARCYFIFTCIKEIENSN